MLFTISFMIHLRFHQGEAMKRDTVQISNLKLDIITATRCTNICSTAKCNSRYINALTVLQLYNITAKKIKMTLAKKILITLPYQQVTLKQIIAACRGLLVNKEWLIRTQIAGIWVRDFTDMNILILTFKEAEDISAILIRKEKERLELENEIPSD